MSNTVKFILFSGFFGPSRIVYVAEKFVFLYFLTKMHYGKYVQ